MNKKFGVTKTTGKVAFVSVVLVLGWQLQNCIFTTSSFQFDKVGKQAIAVSEILNRRKNEDLKNRTQQLHAELLYGFSESFADPQSSQVVKSGEVPKGISPQNWRSVQEQIISGKYHAYADENGGFETANLNQNLQINYGTDGTTAIADRQGNEFSIHLKAVGIGYSELTTLDAPAEINKEWLETASASKVTYNWNNNLKEWWINSQNGLEQWFSIQEAPAGKKEDEQLRLELAAATEMEILVDKQHVSFVGENTKLEYHKFKAWDANGDALAVHFESSENKKGLVLVLDDKNATYPITIDPLFTNATYIKQSNTNAGDNFGWSVAVSGSRLVVGCFWEGSNATGVNGNQADNSATWAGAAYVFYFNGLSWVQEAYLKASNTDANDWFGYDVAIDGTTIVVSSVVEDSNATGVNGNQSDNSLSSSGAAYVFTYNGSVWSQQAYLKASNTGASDNFGYRVAVYGTTIAVSATNECSSATGINANQLDNSAAFAGAVYLFKYNGINWVQQAYIKASNTGMNDIFGGSLALSGNTLVVGAAGEASNATGINGNQTDNSLSFAGAVYVFTFNGVSWTQQAYLKASNTNANDQFGYSVAISGTTIVVSAVGEASSATGVNGNQSDNSRGYSGAAYVFAYSGGSWNQQAYLKSSNPESWDYYGYDVAISGETIIVGAPYEDSNATGTNGNQTDNSMSSAGAVYVYVYAGGGWSQHTYLKSSNTNAGDGFGYSVAISGSTIAVGAPFEDSNATGINGNQADNSAVDAGAVYTWTLTYPLPLDMGAVQSSCNNDCQQLNWSTYSERDLKEFIIEGSADGIHFEYLESIPAVGNSITESLYSSSNYCSKAFNYFRITSKDIDGTETVQELIAAEQCLNGNSTIVYPNPATDYVYVVLPEHLPIESVYLYSTDGKLLQTIAVEVAMKELVVPIQELAPGIYHFIVGDSTTSFVITH